MAITDIQGSTKRSVAGIAVDGDKLFIARRLPGGAMGGRWEFPGGKVDAGEDDQQALVREYQEEFGMDILSGKLLASTVFRHNSCSRILSAYRIYPQNSVQHLVEHSEWRWATLAEIKILDFADSDRKLLDQLERALEEKLL